MMNNPFLFGIFHEVNINHPAIGVPPYPISISEEPGLSASARVYAMAIDVGAEVVIKATQKTGVAKQSNGHASRGV